MKRVHNLRPYYWGITVYDSIVSLLINNKVSLHLFLHEKLYDMFQKISILVHAELRMDEHPTWHAHCSIKNI